LKSVLIIAIVAVVMIGMMIPSVFAETTILSPSATGEIITEKTIDVNLILIGDEWSSQQSIEIRKNLTLEYEPIIILSDVKKIGIHYNYNYNFLSVSENDSDKLFEYMKKNAMGGDQRDNMILHHNMWVEIYHPEWWGDDNLLTIPYESYDALDIEKYLYDEIIKDDLNLNSENSVNLIFLKGDLSRLNSIHDYTLTSRDASTNESFDAVGLTGYGGNYNFYFFDLYAIPWMDFDWNNYYATGDLFGSWFIPNLMLNLHDCTNVVDNSCFAIIVQEQINDAIQHIITPSPVYPINYKNNYLIDVVVYSMPGSSMITSGMIDKFISIEKITNELESLIPFSDVTVQLSIETVKTRGMTNDFKDSIHSADSIIEYNPWDGTETNYTLLRSEQIKPYLLEWAKERQNTNDENFDWVIPVLIAIDTRPGATYVDNWNVSGFAPAMDFDDESIQPCCAFGILESDNVWKDKLGGTNLVLHEVGHTLGLAHTFESISAELGNDSNNEFWNQYASPMTYAGPPSGCGVVFSFVYSNLCGIADASFTEFEKQHMANMIFTSLVQNTKDNLMKYKESESYEFKKYNKINSEIDESLDKFQKINILSNNSPIKDIQQSYIQSQILLDVIPDKILERTEKENTFGELYLDQTTVVYSSYDVQFLKIFGDVDKKLTNSKHVIITIKTPNETIESLKVISNKDKHFETLYRIDRESSIGKYEINAEYSGEISNIRDFEILTSDNINDIGNSLTTEFGKKAFETSIQTKSISPEIPSWIKTNAGWWAEGVIDDETFLSGIEFLIQDEILQVKSIESIWGDEYINELPSWIKTNAGWWAEGVLDDETFLSGIEFLIQSGIIRVD
jgi:hypothetical protein